MRQSPESSGRHAYKTPRRSYGQTGSRAPAYRIEIPADIERALKSAASLPTLPAVVANIIRLVDNPRTSARDLERHISTDPALTAKILRLANSAYYGFPNRIGTVSLAVVILGFNTVKAIALTVSVFDMFNTDGHHNGFDAAAFWEHSFGCALAAELLSKIVRYRAKGEAFTAGVLHDIGKVALNYFMKDQFEEVMRIVGRESLHISEAEKRVLGATHAEVGGWLTQLWNLPHHLSECISLHHAPGKAEMDPDLTAIVHLADILCRTREIGSGGDRIIPEVDESVWPTLRLGNFGFEEGNLECLLARFDTEMDRLDAFSSVIRGVADESPERTDE